MSRPKATCQCAELSGYPCDVPASQEDLLCDACRAVLKSGGEARCAPFQIQEHSWFHWGFTMAWLEPLSP